MWDTLILWFFASSIFVIIAYILGYQLVKYLKGTVKINFPQRIYTYGEKISGYIDIEARKHIEVEKVELELKAYKKEQVHTNNGTRVRNVEVFSQIEEVSWADSIFAGSQRSIWFEMLIPTLGELPNDVKKTIENYESVMAGTLRRFSRKSAFTQRIRWKVRVRVVVKGVDLYRQEHLDVKLSERKI